MNDHSLNQLIIDCLNAYYGIAVIKTKALPLGADMNSSLYKVETSEELSYFVKLKCNSYDDISMDIFELLHNAKIQQIIPPLKTLQEKPSQRIDNFIVTVYPFVEGQNGFDLSLTDEQWLILGKTLRQLHEINVPLLIQYRIRREDYSSQWREGVRSLYSSLGGNLGSKRASDEIESKLLIFLRKNEMKIHRLVDRAEQLGKKLQEEPSEFVLCHSDIHGGNILIDKKNKIYIVDWDEPIMAPKERDLMFIGGGVGNVWNKPHEEALFYKGYGKTEINMTILAYYRHERIVEDIALLTQDLLKTTSENKDRLEMYKHFMAMFEPNGVVNIAFKTHERQIDRDTI